MKLNRKTASWSIAILAAALLVTAGMTGVTFGAAAPANAGFEKLKTLVGTWESPMDGGGSYTVTYRLVSNGTVLMEESSVEAMVTMYHPDGDSVMLTHYCAGNNQPRMRAAGLTQGNVLNFRFVDVTNAAAAKEGIMKDLKITFDDADHYSAEWTNSDKDGKESPYTFHLKRRK